jgi:hypothetical protein
MEDLNQKIDIMCREKFRRLIAENIVRLGNISIRHTKNNKKLSLEHLETICSSYEKVVRDIPRQLLKIEKMVRLKYLEPMSDKRRCDITRQMSTDVELLINGMVNEYRDVYSKHHKTDEFEQRAQAILVASKKKIEEETVKLAAILDQETIGSDRVPPAELAKVYGLDESTLVDLNAIRPLQNLHQAFDCLSRDERAQAVFHGIQRSIVLCSKFGAEVEVDEKQSRTVEARRLRKNSMVAGTLVLQELIYNIQIMVEQFQLPEERRNGSIVCKTWDRLKDLLKGQEGEEQVLNCLTPFFQMFALHEKKEGV